MLETFCANATLRTFLQRPGVPNILQRFEPILESSFGLDQRGTLMSDIRELQLEADRTDTSSESRTQLDKDVRSALRKYLLDNGYTGPVPYEAKTHPRHRINGLMYAVNTANKRDSFVYYSDARTSGLVPAVIRQIFTVSSTDQSNGTFLAVQKFLPKTIPDPFDRYPEFGARLWSIDLDPSIFVICATQKICHGIQRKWGENHVVMRPMNKV